MELQISEKFQISDQQIVTLKERRERSTIDKSAYNFLLNDLNEEGGTEVVKYLEKYSLLQASNFILLSSKRHYFYDTEELKKIKTVINLNLLNRTDQVKYCLQTLNYVLPQNGILAGCFINYRSQENMKLKKNMITFQHINKFLIIYNKLIINLISAYKWAKYILNQGKVKYLTTNEACKILKKNGFRIIDVTEINGLSYFISSKEDYSSRPKP
jgi:hypothetical protein